MTRTLLLAERPFRDARSRALLADLPARLGETALLIPSAAPRWPPGFESVPPEADPATLGLGRVLLAGCYQSRVHVDQILAVAARAVAAGARLEVRRLSLEGGVVRVAAPAAIGVLDAAAEIEVRDHASADALLVWRVAAPLAIRPYPERDVPTDPALGQRLPPGPVLGLSILGGAEAEAVLASQLPRLRARLAAFRGWPVLPLPAEAPGAPHDDLPGSLAFARAVLPGAPVLLPEMGDPEWRRRNLTPPRLAGLVARCATVVASQDLPAALAVAHRIPVLGIALGRERRIAACLATLANLLPSGSDLLVLR